MEGALVNNKNRVGVMAAMQMFCGSVGGILVVNFWQCWQRKFISSRVGSYLETFDAAGVVVHFKKSRSPEVCDVCHDGKHWVKNCSLVAEARELRQLRAGGAAGQMG